MFSVSENVKKEKKDGSISHDAEANWDELFTKWLLPDSLVAGKSKRRSSSKTFCTILPWILFCFCLFLLSCTATWGWKQHFLAQDLLTKIAAEKTNNLGNVLPDTPVPEESVASPSASKGPQPYGNDGLAPEQPSQIEEVVINEEVEITVIEEHVVEEDIVGEENPEQPQADPEDPLASDAGLFAPPGMFLPPLVLPDGPSGVPCDDGVEPANSAAPEGVKNAEQPHKSVDIVGISRDHLPID